MEDKNYIKMLMDKGFFTDEQKKQIINDFPELAESEDEQIRKWLIVQMSSIVNTEAVKELDKNGYEMATKAITYLEKQKEQKSAESISQLTVQGKGVYKICPRCKERMVRDDSKVYTSMPPQYGYECPKCGERVFDTVMYDNPEIEEQKSAEWSKNDTVFLNEITDFFENKTVRLQHDLDMYAHWLKSLPERFNLQPKQEWSEEDGDNLERVDNYLWMLDNYVGDDCAMPQGKTDKIRGNIQRILSPWLKSLPERFNPQPKQEWSEEDERKYQCIRNILLTDMGKKVGSWKYSEILEWYEKRGIGRYTNFKPSWKPSEEQMKWLRDVIETVPMTCRQQIPLESLYNDLKKLM